MAASTTRCNRMPGLRLRYGRGVGRGRISTGYSGYHPNGGRPPDAPRLAMWSPPPRHVAIWVSNDPQRCRGHSWCSISGGSRSHGVLSSKKPSYPVFFLTRGLLTTEVLGSNLQNRLGMTSLRAQEAKIFRCATSLWRCAPALARTYGGGTTSAGRCRRARADRVRLQVHREGARRRLLPREQEGR